MSRYLLFIFLLTCFTAGGQDIMGTWNGTMKMEENYQTITGNVKRICEVTIINNRATGWVKEEGEAIIEGKVICTSRCEGNGAATLWRVSLNSDDTYDLESMTPAYRCTHQGPLCESSSTDMHEISIQVSAEPMNGNRTTLSGTKTNPVNQPGLLTGTQIVTWNLHRSVDVELIVTPTPYDTWLPEPGTNELKHGPVTMRIQLQLRGRGGSPTQVKADAFELKLIGTSREKGMTINYPLEPVIDLPDLRFMVQPNAQLSEEFQVIKINCPGGGCNTASAQVASYDGGGWTTLVAVAILDDGSRVTGTLIDPSGVREIPIPKREPGSNIASAWLSRYGNLADNEDKERSDDNNHEGDGLSVYEEYRGVFSMNGFKRLDPSKKETGVKFKRELLRVFSGGFSLFERASDINVIRFFDTEIGPDRRMNKHAGNAHVYDQYVQHLDTGYLGGDVMGQNQPITILDKLPQQSVKVVIDTRNITRNYNAQVRLLAGTSVRMPNTLAEEIDNTVAHELAHGLGVNHHGMPTQIPGVRIPGSSVDVYRVYASDNSEITDRPYPATGLIENIGLPGNDESGDIQCIMAYVNQYQWVHRYVSGELHYYAVKPLPPGNRFCTSTEGKGINENDKFFGNATYGDCRGKLKLKP